MPFNVPLSLLSLLSLTTRCPISIFCPSLSFVSLWRRDSPLIPLCFSVEPSLSVSHTLSLTREVALLDCPPYYGRLSLPSRVVPSEPGPVPPSDRTLPRFLWLTPCYPSASDTLTATSSIKPPPGPPFSALVIFVTHALRSNTDKNILSISENFEKGKRSEVVWRMRRPQTPLAALIFALSSTVVCLFAFW
jgi:hypothetical protein